MGALNGKSVEVNATGGTATANYLTLKAAFDAINAELTRL